MMSMQVYEDENRDEDITLSAVGVLGDLADVFGERVVPLYQQQPQFFKEFLSECMEDDEDKVLCNTASFANTSIMKILKGRA